MKAVEVTTCANCPHGSGKVCGEEYGECLLPELDPADRRDVVPAGYWVEKDWTWEWGTTDKPATPIGKEMTEAEARAACRGHRAAQPHAASHGDAPDGWRRREGGGLERKDGARHYMVHVHDSAVPTLVARVMDDFEKRWQPYDPPVAVARAAVAIAKPATSNDARTGDASCSPSGWDEVIAARDAMLTAPGICEDDASRCVAPVTGSTKLRVNDRVEATVVGSVEEIGEGEEEGEVLVMFDPEKPGLWLPVADVRPAGGQDR